jgi:hypothetical protein
MVWELLNSIEFYITLISIIVAIVSFIGWIQKWDIFKSIFYKNKFRFKFYRYINYLMIRDQKWVLNLKESYYEFKDRTHMFHRKKFEVISCVNNLTFFEDKYQWSKPGSVCHPKLINEEQEFIHQWIKDNSNFYIIKLARPYPKNHDFISGIKMDLVDIEKESQLYLNACIYEKTKLLRLIVKFNSNLIPKAVKISIFKDFHHDIGRRYEKEIPFNYRESIIIFEEHYPMMNHRYKISWKFNE